MAVKNVRSGRSYQPCPPDGGWGWLVVFGSFMLHVIADGIIYSFGLFYYELDKHFGESKTATSMVVSIMNGTTYCIGKWFLRKAFFVVKIKIQIFRNRTDCKRINHQIWLSYCNDCWCNIC